MPFSYDNCNNYEKSNYLKNYFNLSARKKKI